MTEISVVDYRSTPTLDAELAELGCDAVRGWPDQRPFTASWVRSVLRPTSLTATTLALHRDAQGRLLAAAAVRWPATLEAPGRLWGPMVRPEAQGLGLARALLLAVADIMATHPGVQVVTSEIPESRTVGWSLFERAGWRSIETSTLLSRPLAAAEPITPVESPRVSVRAVRPGEYVNQALAELFSAVRPQLGYATARDTYARWTADARYVSDGLLLAEDPQLRGGSGDLLGAALVYPLGGGDTGEPVEALLADLLTAARLDPITSAEVRAALVAAALTVGVKVGAAIARVVVDDAEMIATLRAAGFGVVDQIRYYSPPVAAEVPTVPTVPLVLTTAR